MGNRAVIAFGKKQDSLGIYLHWNGGVESVLAFLHATDKLGHRDPMVDNYGIARMCQVIGNFFGGTTSIGVDTLKRLDCDNRDNGVFYVDYGWEIDSRKFNRSDDTAMRVSDLTAKQREYYEGVLASVLEKNREPQKEAA